MKGKVIFVAIQKELTKYSVAEMILEYAYFAPAFTVDDLVLSLCQYRAYQRVTVGMNTLKERGYIESAGDKKKAYWRISPAGISYLAHQDGYYRDRNGAAPQLAFSEFQPKASRWSVMAFLIGSGVNAYPKHKPGFSDFLYLVSNSVPVGYEPYQNLSYSAVPEERIRSYLEDGIYYSKEEIVSSLYELGKGTESFFSSSVIGVVFNLHGIYVIYNASGYSVIWRDVENRFMEMLQGLFFTSELYRNRRPVCVFTGKSYALAAAFTTCFLHGRLKEEKAQAERDEELMLQMTEEERKVYQQEIRDRKEKKRKNDKIKRSIKRSFGTKDQKKPRYTFFTAECDCFQEIYYVPVGRKHILTMVNILNHDFKELAAEGSTWFALHGGFRQNPTARDLICGYSTTSDLKAAYLPVAELKTLYQLRNGLEVVSVITSPEIADCISHCLGPRAGFFYDTDGNPLEEVKRYDEYGYPIGGSQYEEISRRAKERATEEKEERTNLTTSVPVAVKAQIRKAAKGRKMSVSAYTGKLLQFALEHDEEFDGWFQDQSRKEKDEG